MALPLQLARPVGPQQVAGAALVGLVFAVYLAAVLLVAAPTDAHWAAADPILAIGPRWSVWLIVAGGLVAALAWWVAARPAGDVVVSAVGQLVLGAVAAAAAAGLLRLIVGPEMPAAIPSEESAAPGFALSMAAGYAEEVLFRLLLAPLLYLALVGRLRRPLAIAITAIVTGLAFAFLHEAGGGDADTAYFITRTLIPGAGMTIIFFAIGPGFLIGLHGAAHLVIPALF